MAEEGFRLLDTYISFLEHLVFGKCPVEKYLEIGDFQTFENIDLAS